MDAFEREKQHGFEFRLKEYMTQAGIPPRVQKATLDPIPKTIQQLKAFMLFPQRPFGLTGPGGCGKSCALSYLVKQAYLEDFEAFGPNRLDKRIGMQGADVLVKYEPSFDLIWVNWPAKAIEMKQLASRRDWDNPAASLLKTMERIKQGGPKAILIMDDFGMERLKGEKGYAQEQLELLVDVAYNWECRFFWTSNNSLELLADEAYYGYRMMSRIAGLAPDIKLDDKLPDLRAQGLHA